MNDTIPATWTERFKEGGTIIDRMRIVPTGRPGMPDYTKSWYRRHNECISDYLRASVGAVSKLHADERRILDLALAIGRWAEVNGDDGFGGDHVLVPLLQAFIEALNFTCGRLDCGTLSEWAHSVAHGHGLDLDA